MRSKLMWIRDCIARYGTILRVLLVVVLFSILFTMIHPADILKAFRSADRRYLAVAVLLLIPNMLLQILKWRFILRLLSPRPPLRMVVESLFGGFFLAASTPGRTGELARGVLMPGYSNVRIASLTVVDKGFSQLMIVLSGLAALGWALPWPLKFLPWCAGIVLVISVFSIHRLRPILERFLNRFLKSETIGHGLAAFDALSCGTVLGMMAYSLAFYLTFTTQLYILVCCFTTVPAIVGLQTIPLIFFINTLLPISIGDVGVKDFAAVQVLGRHGISGASILSATLTQNVLGFLIPSIIGGFVFLVTKHLPLRSISKKAPDNGQQSSTTPPRDDSETV